MRDPLTGPFRVTPPLPSDNGGQGRACQGPDCVVARVLASTTGGLLVVEVRARDVGAP